MTVTTLTEVQRDKNARDKVRGGEGEGGRRAEGREGRRMMVSLDEPDGKRRGGRGVV